MKLFEKEESSVETQVVTAMTKQKQVAVLGLSITDIYDKTQGGTIFGLDIPLSEKTAYLKGTFEAKLGFDGKKVEIKKSKTEENTYDILIPEFIIVGISNPDFKVLDNKGEFLSFTTEDIDTHELANKAMNNKTLNKYIKMNEEWLKEQSKEYYESILKSVDSKAKLRINFEKEK
ncbi:hypothetical protein [Vagococcus hydrophili]|uniref:DUF4230 domain-containing protein n=1 Tax=Vagococcus hydrophili TaxID=2714947 RepID=A0A6G8AVS7_9ENTE|nr:hypothetical protein [Vagococcus hydrophili]QIL49097.1 hypothetical protein G7082_11660 [Vagococcus hydrophili]